VFVKKHQQKLSEKQKQQLMLGLPWVGQRRKQRLREIDQGIVDVLEFDVDRIWDINGCRPPCCPYTLLFRTSDSLFVYLETWQDIKQQNESSLRIESTPEARKILNVAVGAFESVRHTEAL